MPSSHSELHDIIRTFWRQKATIYRETMQKEIWAPIQPGIWCGNSSPNNVSPYHISPKTFHPITFHPIHVSTNTTFHPNHVSPNSRFAQTTLTKEFHPKKKFYSKFYLELIKVISLNL